MGFDKEKKAGKLGLERALGALEASGWREDGQSLADRISKGAETAREWASSKAGSEGWAAKPFLRALFEPGSDMEAACAGADPRWMAWPLWRVMGAPAKIAGRVEGVMALDPVQFAAWMGRADAVSAFMGLGASANRYSEGVTAVGLAGYHGHPGVLAAMRGHGANLRLEILPEHEPTRRETHGSTLLRRVCERGSQNREALCAVLMVLLSDRESYPEAAAPLDAPAWLAGCPAHSREKFEQAWAWARSVAESEILEAEAKPAGKRAGKGLAL